MIKKYLPNASTYHNIFSDFDSFLSIVYKSISNNSDRYGNSQLDWRKIGLDHRAINKTNTI